MTTLQEAVQAFADKGMLMSIRRHNTEEVCFLKEGGEPLATSRSRRIQDLTFRSTPLADRLIETDFILEYVPPISGLDHLWSKYRGVFHIVVRNITIHSSLVRDLSSEPPMDPGYDMMMHQLREDPHAVKEPVIYAPPAYQMTPEYLAARDYLMNAGMTREEATKELVDF